MTWLINGASIAYLNSVLTRCTSLLIVEGPEPAFTQAAQAVKVGGVQVDDDPMLAKCLQHALVVAAYSLNARNDSSPASRAFFLKLRKAPRGRT